MARKLYVGGLSFNTTDDRLKEEFAKFGAVESATVIQDRYTERSRGFGFVEMSNDSEAEEAIKGLNNTTLDDRQITVNYAKERTDRGDRGGGVGGGGGTRRY
ncbi:MAG: RNA-binding protein [Dehalococcoidia bacterium]|nr:RNA-binding protein [Dehalococcoidia bacterium]